MLRGAALTLAGVVCACDLPIATTDATEGPQVTFTTPADGAREVPRNSAFGVDFDRLLLPQTVSRATVRVQSGARRMLLSVRFDPLDRAIVAVPFDERLLEPRVTYRLVVEDVRDLADGRLASSHEVVFRTGSSLVRAHRPPAVAYADVAPIFATSCGGGGCHGGDRPAMGLDLSSPEGVTATAIGVPTVQLRAGTAGVEGASGSLVLAGLPIIDVAASGGQPARSYLVYKILGEGPILGDAMPPPGHGRPPLAYAELRLILDWILSGAPTD